MQFVQAKHFYVGGNIPRLIVIHDMEYPEKPNGAEWCADFFAGRNGMTAPQASAHYCVDNDSVVQCVKEIDGAWHTPGSLPGKGGLEINRQSIGIEHAGYAKQSRDEWLDAYSMAELQISAQLVAELCWRHNIPARHLSPDELKAGARGIVGHVDCTKATGVGSHWDPGPHFPWDWYLDRVERCLALLAGTSPDLIPDDSTWPRVELDGVTYAVAPIYIPFVGIGQAEELAAKLGCELPTPALVDAIWRAADCKLDAMRLIRSHDGTPRTMAGLEMFESQGQRIKELVGDRSLGIDWQLQAGTFKDIVKLNGVLGIYGWHRLDGTVIQPFYSKHVRGWLDYSQGLRLVRRV